MSLHKFARFLNKVTDNTLGGLALTFGIAAGTGVGLNQITTDEMDHNGVSNQSVQVHETAMLKMDQMQPLMKQYNVLKKKKELNELENGSWSYNSDQMKEFQGEKYALTAGIEYASEQWLGGLMQNSQVSEVDFSNMLKSFDEAGYLTKAFSAKELAENANSLQECQISSANNGISKTEATEIASCMDDANDNGMVVTLGSFGAFWATMMFMISYPGGPGRQFENWAKDRATRQRRKPQIKRN